MPFARLRSFLRALVARRHLEHEMDTELQFHLEARIDDLVASGLDRVEATRQARVEFGAADRWKEEGREARGLRFVDQLRADLRYGVRGLRRSPAFAAAAILSVAIGIGANGAIFSLVNAVLLRLMPVNDPASLVLLGRSTDSSGLGNSFPYPFYKQLDAEATSFAGVICSASMGPSVDIDGLPERVSGELVSGNYFDVLGVRPHLGRLLTADDDRMPGAHPVVVLSHGYWQRRFGGDPLVIGRTIRINTHAMTIVGVTPPGFYGIELGAPRDIRVPIAMQAEMHASPSRRDSPRSWWLQIVGRLRPAVSRAVAEHETHAIFQQYVATLPGDPWTEEFRVTLFDGAQGRQKLQTVFAQPLTVLSVLATAVLLLVCLNVANLLIARAAARRREISIRLAVGAQRSRIAMQLLVESLLIAVTGGALGLLLADRGARALASMAVPATTGPALETTMDLRVLAFIAAITTLTGIACGLIPALAASRTDAGRALNMDNRQVVGSRLLGRRVLVMAQIALSFALLVGAGLFARTLANLRYQDFGFDAEHLVQLTLDPTLSGYEQPQLRLFYDDVIQRVAAVPAVQSASLGTMRLLGQSMWGSGLTLDTGVRDDNPGPLRNAVGPGYFSTIGLPLVAGREFTAADSATAETVAVVNDAFARRYFDGQAIGRRIGQGGSSGSADFTIVGVVRDSKAAQVHETPGPMWYVPYAQLGQVGQLTLHVRTRGDADAVAGEVRRVVAAVDPHVTTFGMMTMEQQIADQLPVERVLATLATGFAGIAVLLAALGLYGVTSYAILARTREFGLRIALGATPSSIRRLVLRQTTLLTILGLALGLALAVGGVGYVRSLLFGIEPGDPVTLALAAIVVASVTTLAAWLPARRASRVNPTTALSA